MIDLITEFILKNKEERKAAEEARKNKEKRIAVLKAKIKKLKKERKICKSARDKIACYGKYNEPIADANTEIMKLS